MNMLHIVKNLLQRSMIGLMLLLMHAAQGQVSELGIPVSVTPDSVHLSPLANVDQAMMPAVNVDSLLLADSLEASMGYSYRFGHVINANKSFSNSGTWDTLPDSSKVWRLKIASPNALSLNFIFSYYKLPPGAKLFIYNEDKSMVMGAFTNRNNNAITNKFSTDVISGDTITFEYIEPASVLYSGQITLSKVIHGYKNSLPYSYESDLSLECNIDVNCGIAANWCVEKRSVVMILKSDNNRWCSGALLNNLKQDGAPYVMTAHHCVDSNYNGIISPSEIEDTETWIFRFHYWSDACDSEDSVIYSHTSVSGCTIKNLNHHMDMALLELNDVPNVGIVYSGWNNEVNGDSPNYQLTPPVSISHPKGDLMKFAIGYGETSLHNESTKEGDTECTPFEEEITNFSYWKATWDVGLTQPGSSGSPLFDSLHRIIGACSHGPSFQSCDVNNWKWSTYGKFGHAYWGYQGLLPASAGFREFLNPESVDDPFGVFAENTLDHWAPATKLSNATINTGPHMYSGVTSLEVEGLRYIGAPENPPVWWPDYFLDNYEPFVIQADGDVTVKAGKRVLIKRGVHIEPGARFHAYTGPVSCDENITDGNERRPTTMNLAKMMKGKKGTSSPNVNDPAEEPAYAGDITVYPNPTQGTFKISSNGSELKRVYVYNSLGSIIYQTSAVSREILIDLTKHSAGVYMVRAEKNNGEVKVMKITRE